MSSCLINSGPRMARRSYWRRPETTRTTESCPRLDVGYLSARGCLHPGWSGISQGILGNGATSFILVAEVGQLQLSWHSHLAGEDECVDTAETVAIAYAPCRFGGSRPYFICPGDGCGRRVTKLYLANRYFLCRHCNQLAYASRYERPWQRASRRANKLRQRLGIAEIAAPLPEMPTGMLAGTYARLLDEVLQAEIRAIEACTNRFQWFVARIGKP